MPSLAQPVERRLDLGRLAVDLADDPAPVLLDVGPPDVRLDVEPAHQAWPAPGRRTSDSGNVSFTLTRTVARRAAASAPVRRASARHRGSGCRAEALEVQGDEGEAGAAHAPRPPRPGAPRPRPARPARPRCGPPRRGGAPAAARSPSACSAASAGLDRGQRPERDRRAVGQARGQAGGGRLVPGAQAQARATSARTSSLVKPGLDEGEAGAGAGRGRLAGAVVAQVARRSPRAPRWRPRAAASGPSASIRAVLQRAQRSGPLAT